MQAKSSQSQKRTWPKCNNLIIFLFFYLNVSVTESKFVLLKLIVIFQNQKNGYDNDKPLLLLFDPSIPLTFSIYSLGLVEDLEKVAHLCS